jgi:molybdopterin/thiamine biosynthesis adenylyltransferase
MAAAAMPESGKIPTTLNNIFEVAIADVSAALLKYGTNVQILKDKDLALYSAQSFKAGWRIPIAFADERIRHLDILLPPSFPWRAPRIALVERPDFLTWPHVEKNGLLCLVYENYLINSYDPIGIVRDCLAMACDLVQKLLFCACDEDFYSELLSYWDYGTDYVGPPLLSLLTPSPPSRRVRVWKGKAQYVVANDEITIENWLRNRYGKIDRFETHEAGFFWVDRPIKPSEYPRSVHDLKSIISTGADAEILEKLALSQANKIIVFIGFLTTNGPALVAATITPNRISGYGRSPALAKGFRPGHTPPAILASRFFSGAKVNRGSVERADPAWVHGRGQDTRAQNLRGKTVVVIGCGSIGAPVVISLAQAGVGHLVLVDYDILKWPNISRHPLGASAIGQNKATALANRLKTDYPHTTFSHYIRNIHDLISYEPNILNNCDLVLSATGNWAAEVHLDAWLSENKKEVPVLYAWTEAHACAGHAVLICPNDSTLRSGFDNLGTPLLNVTTWQESTTKQEPACGAIYQPYGSIELGFTNSLVGELALDALLSQQNHSIHRIWAGPHSRVIQLGGNWSPEWIGIAQNRLEGNFKVERIWGVDIPATKTQEVI